MAMFLLELAEHLAPPRSLCSLDTTKKKLVAHGAAHHLRRGDFPPLRFGKSWARSALYNSMKRDDETFAQNRGQDKIA